MKIYNYIFLLSLLIVVSSCTEKETPDNVLGLKPIYGTTDDLAKYIKTVEPQPIKVPGKIYVKANLLFINDVGLGVHVIDNTDDTNPIKIKFITIPGNVDIAIKGNYLYADMGSGLATLDISDLDHITIENFNNGYLKDNFHIEPPSSLIASINSTKVYYECPDSDKGEVIAWVREEMPKPQCYINH